MALSQIISKSNIITMRLLAISIFLVSIAFSCKSKQAMSNETAEQTVQTRNGNRGDRPNRGERGERPSIDEIFKMDVNSDGLLSKTEVGDSPLARRFDDIDSNKDGFISKSEFENAPRPQRGQRGNRN